MTPSGSILRDAYRRARTFRQRKDYKPDTREDKQWDDIAEYMIRNGCPDMELLVEAVFTFAPSVKAGCPPFPNQLKGPKAVQYYRKHIQQTARAENVLTEISTNRDISEYDVVMIRKSKFRSDWAMYELYVKQAIFCGNSIQKILLNEHIPLASFFRIVHACILMKKPDPELQSAGREVWEKYIAEARFAVNEDTVLREFLEKEKGINATAIFG